MSQQSPQSLPRYRMSSASGWAVNSDVERAVRGENRVGRRRTVFVIGKRSLKPYFQRGRTGLVRLRRRKGRRQSDEFVSSSKSRSSWIEVIDDDSSSESISDRIEKTFSVEALLDKAESKPVNRQKELRQVEERLSRQEARLAELVMKKKKVKEEGREIALEVREVGQQLDKLVQHVEIKKADIGELEKEKKMVMKEVQSSKETVRDMNERLVERQQKKEQLKQQCKHEKARLDGFQLAVGDAEASLSVLEKRMCEVEAEVGRQESILASVTSKVERKAKELTSLRDEEEKRMAQQTQIADQCERLANLVERAQAEKKDIEKACKYQKAELAVGEKDLQEMDGKLTRLGHTLNQRELELGKLVEKIDHKKTRVTKLDVAIENKEKELADLQHVFELERRSFNQLVEKRCKFFHPKQAVLKDLQRGFRQIEADIERYEKQMRTLEASTAEMNSLKAAIKKKEREYRSVSERLEALKAEVLACEEEMNEKRLIVAELERVRWEGEAERRRFVGVLSEILGRDVGLERDVVKGYREAMDLVKCKVQELGHVERLVVEKRQELDEARCAVERERRTWDVRRDRVKADEERLDFMRDEMKGLEEEMAKAVHTVDEIERKAVESDQSYKSVVFDLNKTLDGLEEAKKELATIQTETRQTKIRKEDKRLIFDKNPRHVDRTVEPPRSEVKENQQDTHQLVKSCRNLRQRVAKLRQNLDSSVLLEPKPMAFSTPLRARNGVTAEFRVSLPADGLNVDEGRSSALGGCDSEDRNGLLYGPLGSSGPFLTKHSAARAHSEMVEFQLRLQQEVLKNALLDRLSLHEAHCSEHRLQTTRSVSAVRNRMGNEKVDV